ncbi:MAG: rhodanese-like domain-containing protein [Burkholderiaceae bacterium]
MKSVEPAADAVYPALQRAREVAARDGLSYAGGVSPTSAWALVRSRLAVLVDVRSAEERRCAGYVPDSEHVAWTSATTRGRNPEFARELEAKVGKNDIVLLLCQSGWGSAVAAEAAAKAGFRNIFNVLEGFEGDPDDSKQRGVAKGWRPRGLPWVQDSISS